MVENQNKFKGIFNWSFFVIAIAVVVLLNVIFSYLNFRIDATKDKRFSLSQGTINYLKNEEKLNNRLLLKIYLDGNLPSDLQYFRDAVEDKLKEFKQFAGKKIEYEFINPTKARKVNNKNYSKTYTPKEKE